VGEVKEGWGRRKEGVGRKACGGEGEYAPLALGRMDAAVQKHRLIARKIIFIIPSCTPCVLLEVQLARLLHRH